MSGWDCSCGRHNGLLTDTCPACAGFRAMTDAKTMGQPFADPRMTANVCQRCGRAPATHFMFNRNQGFLVVRRRFTHEGYYCRSCATGAYRAVQARNLTEGWYGTISLFATAADGFGNLADLHRGRRSLDDPMPSDPQREARLKGRPTIVQMLFRPMGILAVLALVAILAAILAPANASSSADKTYVDQLVSINASRNTVVSAANAKITAWEKKAANQPPTAEDLVIKELADLQAGAAAMPLPASPELRGLQETWLARLAALVVAEKNLAAFYSSQAATTDQQAWADEGSAFSALVSYAKAHHQ